MLSAELHPCAEPGCRHWTLWAHCKEHETDADRERRETADVAAVEFMLARDHWLAALRADEPTAVVESTRALRTANARRTETEQAAGLVQR